MATASFILDCLSTEDCLKTMGGERLQVCPSGRSWKERLMVDVGDRIEVTHIHHGTHSCFIGQITATAPEVEYEIVEQADGDKCPVCGG
ncbi:MAG: hypothetical protein QF662_02340 [Phycisphaerae bacterium]|jgi:hypothetical protein|nr:hypothetical protein [Phycisphaerae bacterium]